MMIESGDSDKKLKRAQVLVPLSPDAKKVARRKALEEAEKKKKAPKPEGQDDEARMLMELKRLMRERELEKTIRSF
jgi:hypothetical protein